MQPVRLRQYKAVRKTQWIKKLLGLGMRYEVVVLEECDSREELASLEMKWIAHGRAEGWSLTNATDGGEGTKNPTPETRARMSKASKKKRTPELRRRQSELSKDRARKTIGEMRLRALGNTNAKGHSVSAETKARFSNLARGKKQSVETVEKRKATTRLRKHLGLIGRNAVLKSSADTRRNWSARARRNLRLIRDGIIRTPASRWSWTGGCWEWGK